MIYHTYPRYGNFNVEVFKQEKVQLDTKFVPNPEEACCEWAWKKIALKLELGTP